MRYKRTFVTFKNVVYTFASFDASEEAHRRVGGMVVETVKGIEAEILDVERIENLIAAYKHALKYYFRTHFYVEEE